MGPSGSGKSTLLHILAGLDRPSAGTSRSTAAAHDARRPGADPAAPPNFGFVFQFFNLLPTLTAEENRAAARRSRASRPTTRGSTSCSTPSASPTAPAMPSELSGGQQQRVAIARALSAPPALRRRAHRATSTRSGRGEILALLRDASSTTARRP